MIKTTVYLPETLKRTLGDIARQRRTSEANLIRQSIERFVQHHTPRDEASGPGVPLFSGGDPHLAESPEEELVKVFGEW